MNEAVDLRVAQIARHGRVVEVYDDFSELGAGVAFLKIELAVCDLSEDLEQQFIEDCAAFLVVFDVEVEDAEGLLVREPGALVLDVGVEDWAHIVFYRTFRPDWWTV